MIQAVVSDANLHKFWKQFTTIWKHIHFQRSCFRCKFTQILKAIHNLSSPCILLFWVVSDANLHKFWKQFTTIQEKHHWYYKLFPMQIYTNFESNSQLYGIFLYQFLSCFRCKFTQILKAIHNKYRRYVNGGKLFPMQIYTNFESNSQHLSYFWIGWMCCFRCKFTQILKAIHNCYNFASSFSNVVSDANLHKFWKQFTTSYE